MQNDNTGIYRRSEVISLTGLGDNTIRRLMERGEFPKPLQLAPRAIGWKRSDIRAWIDGRTEAHLPPVQRKAKAAA